MTPPKISSQPQASRTPPTKTAKSPATKTRESTPAQGVAPDDTKSAPKLSPFANSARRAKAFKVAADKAAARAEERRSKGAQGLAVTPSSPAKTRAAALEPEVLDAEAKPVRKHKASTGPKSGERSESRTGRSTVSAPTANATRAASRAASRASSTARTAEDEEYDANERDPDDIDPDTDTDADPIDGEDGPIADLVDRATSEARSKSGASDENEEGDADGEKSALPAVRGGAVSVSDPLRRYIEEVRKISLLEPERELELALRLTRDGDVDAARRLVQANLRLVVKIAFEYRRVYANVMDLIQEGNLGLMKAVSKYDTTKGARLGYYASWWIRSYILKYLLDNFRLVKVGTTQAQKKLFFHLMREKERLEAQGTLATPKLIADRLNVKEKEVREMEQRLSSSGSEVSIDVGAPSADGERSRSLSESLPSHESSADDRLIQGQLLSLLEEKLPDFERGLNEKERRLLSDRLLAESPKTLQEVADLYGLTRERARQIEAKVIEKLRDFLKGYL